VKTKEQEIAIELLDKKYNLVGLEGNIDEQGLTRFFKRTGFGVFDQESIREEGEKLARFVREWSRSYGVAYDSFVFLGYSNGANMLLASLFRYPSLFLKLILLHPMMPFVVESGSVDLSEHTVFVSTGLHDQMIPPDEGAKVISTLLSCNAMVMPHEYFGGHEIRDEEIRDVVHFLHD
jgi:phospholipase/carboxylesterase